MKICQELASGMSFLTFTSENEVDLDEWHILKITFRNGLEIGIENFPQHFPQNFPQDFRQDFPATFSCNNFPKRFPTTISCKIFPQEFPARFSHKIFLSWILIGWLPITLFQMLNFHQSLPFLNWLFPLLLVPQEFPARFFSKIFQQDFSSRFSRAGS